MLFSYESAMRELKRLNDSGGEGMYRMVKRWYGWVIVDNYFGNFNMDDGIEIDTKFPPLAMLQRIYDEAHEHKDIARTANDILKLIKELESVSMQPKTIKTNEPE